jgi:peptide chain release factor subunit 1
MENGFNQAIELASETLGNVKFIQEKKLIARYFDEVSLDTGKICFGVEDTMRALEMGAIQILILWEHLEVMRYEFASPASKPEASNTIIYLRPDQQKEKSHAVDPDTGVELELIEKILLSEWLANHYKEFGAALEIITDKSQEGSQFCSGFGGIGGMLRYRVDFAALDYDPELDFDGIDLDDYM